jgi:hypothetical protein
MGVDVEKKAADDDAAAGGRRMAKAAARDNILILCSFRYYVNTSSDNFLSMDTGSQLTT